jgi:Domain of unknown function (DUF4252)
MKERTIKSGFLGMLAVLAILLSALPSFGQGPARLKISGLEKLAAKASEVVDVNLDGPMLKLASKFVDQDEDEKDDVELKQMLQNLKGVYVKSFEFDKEGEYTENDVEAIRAQLHAPGWVRLVSVKSKKQGDNAEIYLMGSESNIQGLAIIAADPKELTVVNIVGPIDLDKLSKLSGHMGVPDITVDRSTTRRETKSDDKKK